jgi:hypothetical protein
VCQCIPHPVNATALVGRIEDAARSGPQTLMKDLCATADFRRFGVE